MLGWDVFLGVVMETRLCMRANESEPPYLVVLLVVRDSFSVFLSSLSMLSPPLSSPTSTCWAGTATTDEPCDSLCWAMLLLFCPSRLLITPFCLSVNTWDPLSSYPAELEVAFVDRFSDLSDGAACCSCWDSSSSFFIVMSLMEQHSGLPRRRKLLQVRQTLCVHGW